MNPLPIAWASLRRNRFTAILFIAIVALTVALGIAISAQERALRIGSARAADKFDLIVAAPGSHNDVLFSTVYLDPSAVPLLDPAMTRLLLEDGQADFVAPIGFGDAIGDAPVVGTTAAFVEHLSGGLAEGRVFAALDEAVVGALSPHAIGDTLEVSHGHGGATGTDADAAADAIAAGTAVPGGDGDHPTITIAGRMQPTGTPWDRAIVVPIEYNWSAHGLGTGHLPGDSHIGPPFDPDSLPGLPAVVVKPVDVAAAYGLRGAYRTPQSTAFFPAEVLVELYSLLGDATAIMSALTLAAQALVVAAILAGIVAILDLQRQQFAVLRALGASRSFIFATVWVYVAALIVTGAIVGLLLGWGFAALVSEALAQQTGVAMRAEIGMSEFRLVGALVALGLVLASLPALLIYRRPVVEGLR
ncbi:FtsX-like permease family protein [Devosia sp.]|uniref:FtsX-like permease family protein n=1 Tax=Devosia sp. TaxID=1871048 RepID=UPI0027346DA1|nr:ABC transporter permease [Devosia sp.]MDP2781207.1 ABC transporter permease [Devosia sp.]